MFAEIEASFRRLCRRFDRSEWAIRNLKLPVASESAEEPGVLLVQIDGFSREELERAIEKKRMPFLARLRGRNGYGLKTFYPGVPSTTPAVQAELYYGVRTGVPAFAFMDRSTGEVGTMFDTKRANQFEKQFAARGDALLKGGSSWSNIYRGGASDDESHFCISELGLGDLGKRGSFLARAWFTILQLPAVFRVAGLVSLELLIGLWDMAFGLLRGQRLLLEVGAILSRMCVGIGLREIVRIGAKLDLARGLPIIHVNFLGYDELAHLRGPDSGLARWSLAGIDFAIEDLYRAALRSHRRDYQVWIFSDHGQERTRSFEFEFSGGIHKIVADCVTPGGSHPDLPRGRVVRRPYFGDSDRKSKDSEKVKKEDEEFALTSMGPVGHIYLKIPVDDGVKTAIAGRLVTQGKIPAVMHLNADGSVTWHDARGSIDASLAADRLSGFSEAMKAELKNDIQELARNENAGDLVILGYSGDGDCWTFAPERGSHASTGPRELRGFLLSPPGTIFPAGCEEFVRPSALRSAILNVLTREKLERKANCDGNRTRLRVMTYNAHSCKGMDGRVSPRRVARVISEQEPDIVAIQELDHGKIRSRGEDQATLIADLLGYHVVYCPTVIAGTERYGHAVLSRLPIETVKVAELPHNPKGVWPERRAALWTRIEMEDTIINVVTTHFGLSSSERLDQMNALLGPDWLGPLLDSEPIILCGDFNCTPGGSCYRTAVGRLRDVSGDAGTHTFSSIRPFTRLDYIFSSHHFDRKEARVIRNDLTRVASDHLPVVADLLFRK
jgi:endonuclease/exonuclease/phosphatase family metal-dependent hydrolase